MNKSKLFYFMGIFLILLSVFVIASENEIILDKTFSEKVSSVSGGFGGAVKQLDGKLQVDEEDSKESLDPFSKEPFNILELGTIARSENSDTYDYKNGSFVTLVYASSLNMKDSEGDYKPYEEVTSFTANEDELFLQWNNKSVKLIFYTKDEGDNKELFSQKDKTKKNDLNFETKIESGRGFYYFNHTLDKSNQPSIVGYEIELKNVEKCFVEGYSLVCDEQQINFEQAVLEQNLSVEIKEDFIEIKGSDLSYIDPSITQYGSHTDTYCEDESYNYDYDADILNDIGSDEDSEEKVILHEEEGIHKEKE